MTAFNPQQLIQQLPPFQSSVTHSAASPAIDAYRDYYRIDFRHQGIDQQLGSLQAAGFNIAVQQFAPAAPRGTVLLVHGYLDHHALYCALIDYLLARGQRVICFDLPGHGLSSGTRVSIDDFNQYQEVLQAVISQLKLHQQPLHLVGQSTGCAIINHYLLSSKPDFIGQVVELAPLVRPNRWRQIQLMQKVLGAMVKEVPRIVTENSHDPAFVEFVARDPLQGQVVSAQWVTALGHWLPQFLQLPADDGYAPLIIQGEEDETVDWRYNLDILQQKFPAARLLMLKQGRHQLAHESLPIRQQIYDWLDRQQLFT